MAVNDLSFPTQEQQNTTCKRNKLIPTPNGHFLALRCQHCKARCIAYSHSQTERRCNVCGIVILKPAGGKAKVMERVDFKRLAINKE